MFIDLARRGLLIAYTLLPSRIKVEEPKIKPHSNTIQFWQVWGKDISSQDLDTAVGNIIKQSKS